MMKKSLLTIVALMLALVMSGGLVASAETAWTHRVDGTDRIDTAIEISQEMYPADAPIGPRYVIIARSDVYADALAGAGLVTDVFIAQSDFPASGEPVINQGDEIPVASPILLTPSNSLDDRVADEIERLGNVGSASSGLAGSVTTENSGTRVYILGGKGAISESVLEDIEDLTGVGANVERVGGDDRYETAAMIDDEMAPGNTMGHQISLTGFTFIATGSNFPDALSAAGYAGAFRAPILLSKMNELTDETMDALDHGDADNCVMVGGTGVLSNDVRDDLNDVCDSVDRVAGDDRYGTAVAFAEDIWGVDTGSDTQRYVFTRGDDFPDALAGAGLVANIGTVNEQVNSSAVQKDFENVPTLLTNSSSLNSVTEDYLIDLFEDNGINQGVQSFVLGGTGAISDGTEEDIAEALSDGDFSPTTNKPEIDEAEVAINNTQDPACDNDEAESNCNESIVVAVTVLDIRNDDLSVGDVTLDTTILGEDDTTTYKENFEMSLVGCSGDDCAFANQIEVESDTDDDNDETVHTNVTLDITATNQAGTDTGETVEFDLQN